MSCDINIDISSGDTSASLVSVNENVAIGSNDIEISIGDDTTSVALADSEINVNLETSTVNRVTYLECDEKLRFNGGSGDTYIVCNSVTNRLEVWVGGVKRVEWGDFSGGNPWG